MRAVGNAVMMMVLGTVMKVVLESTSKDVVEKVVSG